MWQAAQHEEIEVFEPESDFGNIEYKLKLVDPTYDRVEHLTTQMKYRLKVRIVGVNNIIY